MPPELFHARTIIVWARGHAERMRREGRSELGASAIEWAIISAVVVVLALIIAKVITSVVNDNANKIKDGSNY
ncbi:hypothetical protein AB3X52_13260 [Nocardioides sp. DS6]|uniref:Flp family type IVb pilin n=1 Tax=Nocardioides eburneus TaxID=3231482 RepID=A0ABV3T0E6_9ACTN